MTCENYSNWDWCFLEQQSQQRSKYLKVYFVYGNSNSYHKEQREKKLEKLANALNIKCTALTFVPSLSDTETEVDLNKINPEVSNTFIIYRHKAIIDKYVDLKATTSNFKLISNTLDQTKSAYFDFPRARARLNHPELHFSLSIKNTKPGLPEWWQVMYVCAANVNSSRGSSSRTFRWCRKVI